MDVEKIIRVLGYIVYTALWSPVIILTLVVAPIVWLAMFVRAGLPAKDGINACTTALKNSVQHDINFIQTGKW